MSEFEDQSNHTAASEIASPMRVRSIQPDFIDDDLHADQEDVTSRKTVNDLHAVIRHWSLLQDDLPDGFADTCQIQSVARQVIPSVVVRIQRSSRSLFSTLIPFDGSAISNRRFDPKDLFGLSDVDNRCEFPDGERKKSELLQGNESLEVCADCGGAGENVCNKCSGTGSLVCKACKGGGETECRHCRGQGEILVDGVNTQQCVRCKGLGTANCSSCSGKGDNYCPLCNGGTIACSVCDASGQMRQQWHLQTVTHTETYHHLVCRNGWVDDDHPVATDAVILRHRDWPDPQLASSDDTRIVLPDLLYSAARATIDSARRKPSGTQQDTGMRLEVRASYLYHVEVSHEGSISDFFIRGCSNTVAPLSVKRRKKGLLGNLTDHYVVTAEEREYADAVSAGSTFLTDFRGLGEDLLQRDIEIETSDTGYVIPQHQVSNSAEIGIHFDYDQSGQQVIRTTIELGPAERNRLPEYLASNQLLSIGTLGLLEKNNRTVERLILVDSRYFASLSLSTFHHVVQQMAVQSQELIESDCTVQSAAATKARARTKQICEFIKCNVQAIGINAKVSVKHGRGQALLSFRLGNGRKQDGLLSVKSKGEVDFIEIKSRCRAVYDAAGVRSALKRNLSSPSGGFALDTSGDPPVGDLIQRLVLINGQPDYKELMHNLSSIVHRADAIEKTQSDVDEF